MRRVTQAPLLNIVPLYCAARAYVTKLQSNPLGVRMPTSEWIGARLMEGIGLPVPHNTHALFVRIAIIPIHFRVLFVDNGHLFGGPESHFQQTSATGKFICTLFRQAAQLTLRRGSKGSTP